MVKRIVCIISGLAICFGAVVIALFFFQPRIPLGFATGPASFLLTVLTGSEQSITGTYFVTPGAWTTLAVENGSLKLTGEGAFKLKTDIASAQVSVHLWTLLVKKIRLNGIMVHGMTLDLSIGKGEGDATVDSNERKNGDTAFIPSILKQTGTLDLADINGTILSPIADSQIAFQLVQGTGSFRSDSPGSCTLEAVINGNDFRVEAEGGALADLTSPEQAWPFVVHIEHKSVTADLSGSVITMGTEPSLSTEVSLVGEHFDDLVSIVGKHGSKGRPFDLQGKISLLKEEMGAVFSKVQLGSEVFAVSASVKQYQTEERQYTITLQDDLLDLDAVKSFFIPEHEESEKTGNSAGQAKISRDDVLFPKNFPLRNLVLDFDLKEIVMAGNSAKDIRFHVAMVDGLVDGAPFAMTFDNADLCGHFSCNIADSVPRFSVHYGSPFFDMGALLKTFQLSDEIEMRVEKVTTDLQTSGWTLGELFTHLEFSISANEGTCVIHDPDSEALLHIDLGMTKITGIPGEQVSATMQGNIGTTPISIFMGFDDRRDEPPGSVKDVPVDLLVRLADTRLELSGTIPLPFKKEGTVLHSRIAGKRLSSLNELLQLKFPELGPYEAKGSLTMGSQGYSLNTALVQIGSSLLRGDLILDMSSVPPQLDIGLHAQRIQLDDFEPLKMRFQKGEPRDNYSEDLIHEGRDEQLNDFTDQAILDSYNASILIDVEEVLSGADYLGSGTLQIEQQNGRLTVAPLEIRLPGGTVHVDLSVRPFENDRFYTLQMLIENFDYGFLARRFQPTTDMSGILNLRASLESVSQDWYSLLANGSGYLDFSIQPRQLRAGVIDLWAVNLFSYLVPFLTPQGESKINCTAGRFTLGDGILKQEEFLIDTSKIQVKGVVEVDLRKNLINAVLRPIPKRPQFYSLSIPIEIKGSLADMKARLARGGVIGTMIRLATSYVVVPLQWIIQNRIPEDGTAVCLQLAQERIEQAKTRNEKNERSVQ